MSSSSTRILYFFISFHFQSTFPLFFSFPDSNTDETVQDVIIGWDIRRSNGALINLGILADQVMQESNKLQFYSMKSLNSFGDDIHGRCIIYRGNQIYRSDYFKIKVSTLPKEVDVEGKIY